MRGGQRTLEEDYLQLGFLMAACQSQVALLAAGVHQLEQVSSVVFENRLKMSAGGQVRGQRGYWKKKRMLFGQQEFEACVRNLNRVGMNSQCSESSRPELLSHQ